MEWGSIIEGIITLLCTGGVLYLIVDKLFSRKKDNADATTTIISNGNDIADLYKKIDEIVESKTQPIRNELVEVKSELTNIKEHWCCYRENCDLRILTQSYHRKDNAPN